MPSDDLRRRAAEAARGTDGSSDAIAGAVLAAVAGTLPNTTAEIRLWLSAHDLPMTHGVGKVFDALRRDLETK